MAPPSRALAKDRIDPDSARILFEERVFHHRDVVDWIDGVNF